MTQWLIDYVTQWLSDSVTQWLNEWITQWLSGSVFQWLSDSVAQWLSDSVTKWLRDSGNQLLSASIYQWVSDSVTEWLIGLILERLSPRKNINSPLPLSLIRHLNFNFIILGLKGHYTMSQNFSFWKKYYSYQNNFKRRHFSTWCCYIFTLLHCYNHWVIKHILETIYILITAKITS